MVLLLVRSSGGSDLHWLVVRLRGGLEEPTAGYSLSRDSALLLLRGQRGEKLLTHLPDVWERGLWGS